MAVPTRLGRRSFLNWRAGPRFKLFISYRRRFDYGSARLLKDKLTSAFGGGAVFRDVDNIAPGEPFPQSIQSALDSCDVFLLLVSPGWVASVESLRDPDDFVRREIVSALARTPRVIPLLVGGARMPDAGELPEEVRGLTTRQAFELSDIRWDYDVQRLIDAIRESAVVPAPWPASLFGKLVAAAAALLVAASLAFVLWRSFGGDASSVAARIDEVTFDKAGRCAPNEECFWTVFKDGSIVRTGTVSGAYMTDGDLTVSVVPGVGRLSKIVKESSDGALRFSLTLTETLPADTPLLFTVTKRKQGAAAATDSKSWEYRVAYFAVPSITATPTPAPRSQCLREFLPNGRWASINYGDPDERVVVRREQPKGGTAGILLTRGGVEVGAIKFHFVRWSKDAGGNDSGYYEVEQVVDADCRPAEGFVNLSGGEVIGRVSYGWLDISLDGRHYDLRIAYVNDTIVANFRRKQN